MMTLREFIARVDQRKNMLGIVEDAAHTDALRNSGLRRTIAKRELLRRIRQRELDGSMRSQFRADDDEKKGLLF